MRSVLIFNKYYKPAYKAGGPIRSLSNIAHHLGGEFDFNIITKDRDHKDSGSFTGVNVNNWNELENANVFYCSPGKRSALGLWKAARNVQYDALYVNSVFEPIFGIQPQLLWRFSLLKDVPLILAPRGEFSPGAIRIKTVKKRAYLAFFKGLSLHRLVTWHASTEREAGQIREWMGQEAEIKIAGNIPSLVEVNEWKSYSGDQLNIVYLSRVTPKKNLRYALDILKNTDVKIQFNIYGTVDDKAYWKECKNIIEKLPENITTEYRGTVPHKDVGDVFARHDLFFFPTRGENYGHVIFEALASGCPVLLSKNTPWSNIEEEGAGWVVSLDNPAGFHHALRRYVGASDTIRKQWSDQARKVAKAVVQNSETLEQNRTLFREATEG